MNAFVKVVVAIFVVGLVAGSLGAMLAPTAVAAKFAVDPHAIAGLSTLRALVGGLLAGLAGMAILGLVRGEAAWFRATAFMFGVVAFGRLIGFAFDGASADSLQPFGVETFGMILMLIASRRLGGASRG